MLINVLIHDLVKPIIKVTVERMEEKRRKIEIGDSIIDTLKGVIHGALKGLFIAKE